VRRKGVDFLAHGLSVSLTIVAAALCAALLLLSFSSSFLDALGLFFLGPFQNAYYFGNMLSSSVALAVAGLGASIAFGSKNFNLGGEGQVYLGAIASVEVCLALPSLPPSLALPLSLFAAMAVGGLMGSVSGALKRRLDVDELISSFLLSSGLVFVGDFLVTGPLQDPTSNFQTTAEIPAALRLAKIYPPSSLSTSVFVALAVILAVAFFLDRSRLGFELKLTGKNPEFARYVGIDTGAYATAPMAASGALYGLAGGLMVLGSYYKAMKGFSSGIGWSGIAVALLAGNKPLAVIPAALFFAYLDSGAKAVMVGADVTSEIVDIVQSVVFFLVTAKALDSLFRKKRRGPEGGQT
jgi:riboflavin transport system permease protein